MFEVDFFENLNHVIDRIYIFVTQTYHRYACKTRVKREKPN